MKFKKNILLLIFLTVTVLGLTNQISFSDSTDFKKSYFTRDDGAFYFNINLEGSLQRPVMIDDKYMILTNFSDEYSKLPSKIVKIDVRKKTWETLGTDIKYSLNSGASISVFDEGKSIIVYSSKRLNHSEIFYTTEDLNGEKIEEYQLTNREKFSASEPSISPDGKWVVFQSSKILGGEESQIVKYKLDLSSEYIPLTGESDICKNPKFSPDGNLVLYEKFENRRWDIWVTDINGKYHRKITYGKGNKNNGSFSPDGKWIGYSSDENKLKYPNIFIIDTFGGLSKRVTFNNGYDGFPTWSLDGKSLIFESVNSHLHKKNGTLIYIIDIEEDLLKHELKKSYLVD